MKNYHYRPAIFANLTGQTNITPSKKVISVWLDDSNDKVLKKFHCINCGHVVFEYYNSVDLIVNGEHFEKKPKVIMCHGTYSDPSTELFNSRCKTKYYVS